MIRNDLERIANALEHLAFPLVKHEGKTCRICLLKNRPLKRMPPSVVQTVDKIRRREAEIRTAKMMAGPEQPVADMFRYRELNREDS